MVALERGRLDPGLPVGRGHGQGVAVRAEVGDREDPVVVAAAVARLGVLAGDHGRGGVDDRRSVVSKLSGVDLVGDWVLAHVLGAERVAVDVGDEGPEVVRDLTLEVRQPGFSGDVLHGVDRGVVLEHQRPERRVGDRQRLELDRDRHGGGAGGHGEVRAVELVAVGLDRDEVAAGRQLHRRCEVGLVPLRDDRARAGDADDRRPRAAGRAERVRVAGRKRAAEPGRRRGGRGAGVVDVDDVVVVRDCLTLGHGPDGGSRLRAGAHDAQADGCRLGGRAQREQGGDSREGEGEYPPREAACERWRKRWQVHV